MKGILVSARKIRASVLDIGLGREVAATEMIGMIRKFPPARRGRLRVASTYSS